MSSSAQHHSTFCTFDELARPQIFSIARPPGLVRYGASDFETVQPPSWALWVYARSSSIGLSRHGSHEAPRLTPPRSRADARDSSGDPARHRGDEKLEGDGS